MRQGGVLEYARQFLRLQRECRPADLIEQVIGRVWGAERPRGPTDIEGGSDVNENVTFCSLKAKQSLARASEIAPCHVALRSDLAIPSPKGAGPRLPEPISEVISHSSWVIRGGRVWRREGQMGTSPVVTLSLQ